MPALKIRISTIYFATTLVTLLGFSAACLPANSQTITVSNQSGTSRSLLPNFYGDNGQQRNSDLWEQSSNPQFNIALRTLLSGYKLNRFSWLEKHGKSSWEPIC